jgi:hypothetical protein
LFNELTKKEEKHRVLEKHADGVAVDPGVLVEVYVASAHKA